MHTEIRSIGTHGAYAVDLVIGKERFRVKYCEGHRVDPLADAREFSAKLGEAIKVEGQTNLSVKKQEKQCKPIQ